MRPRADRRECAYLAKGTGRRQRSTTVEQPRGPEPVMRVLFYRLHVCQDGIASWTLTLAGQLRRQGVQCAFWFPKVFYRPLEDFERLGPVLTAPSHEAADVLQTGRYDVVHVVNFDHTADLLALVRPTPRIVVTSHGDM